MLDETRIKEAKDNIKKYLADRLIGREAFKPIVFETLRRNHRDSLNLAEHVYHNNLSSLWTVVISYYSMFYLANAVLYRLGYKVGPRLAHKVTADGLIEFVRNKLRKSLLEDYEEIKEEALEIAGAKADTLIYSFDQERTKRSIFQYETTEEIKLGKAGVSFQRAKEFSLELNKLLNDIKP
ncbi:MAG TPA: hypothetical protein VJG31_04295 [Candidatus Nanoarchaeia archaeon]|nr:hypothetical protein [Candidatus Nanoarchaeia archaeon]